MTLARNVTVLSIKQLDEWLRVFLMADPQLNPGWSLDTRITSINLSPDISCYDVDYPALITLCQF